MDTMWKLSQLLLINNSKYVTKRALFSCWKCNENINNTSLICDKCNTIQKPIDKDNYFSILNIDENFDVDVKKLTSKYRQMQSVLHPDKFANKSDEEKVISEEYSSLINKAYNTLQTPLSRAIHMLNLKNTTINENDKASDPQFLMEILELNEEIDECDTDDKLKRLNEKNREILNSIVNEIQKYLKVNDIESAKKSVIKMKYFNSISQRINNLLREKGIVE